MTKKLYILKKRKRDKTFDRRVGEEIRLDMSSKEISLVCKINKVMKSGERGIRPLTVKLGIAFRSDMSSKEISLVCKINIFLYY